LIKTGQILQLKEVPIFYQHCNLFNPIDFHKGRQSYRRSL
jgi:hypothetical protein